jgi:hypothetical protein
MITAEIKTPRGETESEKGKKRDNPKHGQRKK